ncbi:MAG: hypothetical protein IPM66_19985 [Acidobacteriota bacterium]|nr:MAG: hypothetical protein IPM66_19985 [Acidobacteriota bacterium]
MNEAPAKRLSGDALIAAGLSLITFAIYLFSNPEAGSFYDYTVRIAGALLEGRLGLIEPPPGWLNEMIPLEGRFYSAFPLGSVLSMLPLALLVKAGVIEAFPGTLIAAIQAGVAAALLFLIAGRYTRRLPRRIVLTLFPLFGAWMWANLAFAGAWQIALGFALIGQLGALYFILVKKRPLAAGACFALAFGNRTEILLLAPVFLYLLTRGDDTAEARWQAVDRFIAIPVALGVSTLLYNYMRFDSILDFGYSRIPGVLDEPWYRHGIFSIHAIPGNFRAMLLETWRSIPSFPWFAPNGFGGSIFLQSPFLFFIFTRGARDRNLKRLAWISIAALTLVLWLHGNPGGWQVSYRYAIELLPWICLILLESRPEKVTLIEWITLATSIAINAWATYWFLWVAVGGK